MFFFISLPCAAISNIPTIHFRPLNCFRTKVHYYRRLFKHGGNKEAYVTYNTINEPPIYNK